MKILQTSLFRALCSIVVGALLIKYPDNTVTWLTVAVGVLFLVSGAISCVAYFNARRQMSGVTVTDAEGRVLRGGRPMPPVVGMGSLIFGLLLTLTPGVFVTGLMYILGIILVLGAVNQYMVLLSARGFGYVSVGLWICPTLVLLTGLYVLLQPMESASLPLVILGWCSLLYGVTEIVNTLKISAKRKEMTRRVRKEEQEAGADGGAIDQKEVEEP